MIKGRSGKTPIQRIEDLEKIVEELEKRLDFLEHKLRRKATKAKHRRFNNGEEN